MQKDTSAYLIPTSGSNPIGVLGFVNAAFELADQIAMHEIDEPDFIYIATGSCGYCSRSFTRASGGVSI